MRRIPLKKEGKVFMIVATVIMLMVSVAMGIALAWWLGLLLCMAFSGFFLFIYKGLCKYADMNEEYIKKEMERIKSLNNGHEPILVSDEALRNMDKIGGVILEDGTPVRKEELRFL